MDNPAIQEVTYFFHLCLLFYSTTVQLETWTYKEEQLYMMRV